MSRSDSNNCKRSAERNTRTANKAVIAAKQSPSVGAGCFADKVNALKRAERRRIERKKRLVPMFAVRFGIGKYSFPFCAPDMKSACTAVEAYKIAPVQVEYIGSFDVVKGKLEVFNEN